jgi:PIN domain nuclease of toxin-antitoxin system
MRLLLDTHALLWWLGGDLSLSAAAKGAIADDTNEVFVSAATTWEIATKHRGGKLPGVAAIVGDLDTAIAEQGFAGQAVSLRHGQQAGALPRPHRDPFDRMSIAQALAEGMVSISNEQLFDA